MAQLSKWLTLVLFALTANATPKSDLLRVLGPQGVNLWNLEKSHTAPKDPLSYGADDEGQTPIAGTKFRAHWFKQPLDHFSKDNKHTFHQRYWVNDRHYKPGTNAPVIVIDGGETSGEVCNSFNYNYNKLMFWML
jgi:hypothetical protein